MFDNLANVLLVFSHSIIIIPLMVLGFIWVDRRIFYHALCLILLSILVNSALKVSFQIPLPSSLGKEWFAFPSGHMQLSTVLYLWLAYKIPNTVLRLAIALLLTGIGLSLIHFGYHNFYDVLGAIVFALLLLLLYSLSSSRWPKVIPWMVLVVASVLFTYIHIRYAHRLDHVWIAYYALLGVILSEKLVNKKMTAMCFAHKALATVIYFSAFMMVHAIFQLKLVSDLPYYLYQLEWFILSFMIPYSCVLANGIVIAHAQCRLSKR